MKRKFLREEVEKEYSRAAWIYDLWAKATESKATKRSLELADIHDGENILEVAVGTGLAFKEMVDRNTHGTNEGIDISPRMLSAATKRMKAYDTTRYHLQIASAYALPFHDAQFDLVINQYMLDLLPEEDFATLLREFFRVLKPSGRLVVVTMAFGEKWYNGAWHWVARHFPSLLTNCRPVSVARFAIAVGFVRLEAELVSQNTFPSQITTAVKS